MDRSLKWKALAATFGLSAAEESAWRDAGHDPESAMSWLDEGFRSPDDALPWEEAGLAPREAANYAARGITAMQARQERDRLGAGVDAAHEEHIEHPPTRGAGRWRSAPQ
jgi:hypothetical protein